MIPYSMFTFFNFFINKRLTMNSNCSSLEAKLLETLSFVLFASICSFRLLDIRNN